MYGVSCIFGIFFMIEKSRDLCQCYQSYLKIWDNVAMKGKKYILETENYLYPLVKSDTDINIFFSQPPASRRWSCQSHYRFLTIFFFYSLDGSCAPPVFRVSICRNAHVIMWSVLLAFIEPSARTTLHAQLLENEEQDGGGRSKFARPAGKSQGKLDYLLPCTHHPSYLGQSLVCLGLLGHTLGRWLITLTEVVLVKTVG